MSDARFTPSSPTTSREIYSFLLGLLGLGSAIFFLRANHLPISLSALVVIAASVLPMLLWHLLMLQTHRAPSAGLNLEVSKRVWNVRRSCIKWLGLIGTMGVIGLIYWIFPEYHAGFYDSFRQCALLLPWVLLLAFPYILWVDRRMEDPYDGFWHAGCFFIGRWKELKRDVLRAYALGWLVKAFFLPLMFVWLTQNLRTILDWHFQVESFLPFYHLTFNLILLCDVLFACFGYIFTLRILDSHIRSTEPTLLGWFVALLCYEPFWGLIGGQYLHYRISMGWDTWLEHSSAFVQVVWGGSILVLTIIYGWSTMVFGFRFSNLTHRGIITRGPFRFMKHPAYFCKNLSWWLIDVPYLAVGGWLEGLRHCLLLLMLNGVYFLRAKTEERHLSRDADYVAYAAWIREHGIVAKIRKFLRDSQNR
jgi:hypothetical protein